MQQSDQLRRMYLDSPFILHSPIFKMGVKYNIRRDEEEMRRNSSKNRSEFTNEELIKIMQDFYNDNGKNPSINDFKNSNIFPNPSLYRIRFGNWTDALKLAGLRIKENVKLSKIDIDQIIKDYRNGVYVKEIAKKFNIEESRIFDELKKRNIPTKTNKWTKDKIEKLEKLYPNSSWDILLSELTPFRKEDIVTKAYKLKIKRECYGYSDEEERILLDNYGKVSFKKIKELLPNKSDNSIMTKANKMGLVMREKWSDEDTQKLIELYPYYTNEELVNFFPNRTPTAIMSEATMKLNLYKDEQYLSDKYYANEKERLLKELIEFANELKRTPTADEVQENENLSGVSSYYRIFGSYSKACKEAELDVNSNIFGKSFHLISKNGDICLSKKEKEITDILIDNNINYKKEVLYKDIIDNENLINIRCDWFINDEIIVEYFGMPEKEYYRERMNNKIRFCKENDLKLISLFRKDTFHNYTGLVKKFNNYNIDLVI